MCVCVGLLTLPLFLTANLSDFSYSGTKLSTGPHSKSHSAVPLKLCFKGISINVCEA